MKRIIATVTVCVAMAIALVGCASTASPSSSGSSAASSSSTPASETASSASSASSAAGSGMNQSSSSSVSSAAAAPASSGSASSAATPAMTADGKQTATGTVVTTTYAERAAEVGLACDDYKGDTGLLTLLMLDAPIQVTAYKGGGDFTGVASVICLPNDEMFRQFSGKRITISVDSWGEWPADLSGKLYDLVVDFDADGLGLVE